jgi:hypothetical protein
MSLLAGRCCLRCSGRNVSDGGARKRTRETYSFDFVDESVLDQALVEQERVVVNDVDEVWKSVDQLRQLNERSKRRAHLGTKVRVTFARAARFRWDPSNGGKQ